MNISLGRPLTLHDDDINVPLPSAADDDALDQAPAGPFPTSQTTSPFLQHIQMRKIQSKIHRFMYTSRSIQKLPLHEKQAIRRDIFNELQAWQRNLSLLPLLSTDNPSTARSTYLHPSWYQALYHSGCLLLFRPSATFPAMEGLESDGDMNDVIQMVWNSSRLVLAKYFELLQARHLNYSWVCLYTIFMAGLGNVYGVGRCAQRRKRGIIAFLPSFLDVVSDIRDCSNILMAICERWDDARSSCDIFNRLSMSALKELATTSFQQEHEMAAAVEADSNNEQMTTQPTSIITGNGQERGSTGNSLPFLSYQQPSPSPGFPDTDMPVDQYPNIFLSEDDPIVEFEQTFQEMQDALNANGNMKTDEVLLGFSQGRT